MIFRLRMIQIFKDLSFKLNMLKNGEGCLVLNGTILAQQTTLKLNF